MKTLLVLPALPDDSPFLKYYTDWYVENNQDFDVFCLNRKVGVSRKYPSNYIVYNQEIAYGENILKRFVKNFLFYRFVRKKTREGNYARIVLFTLPLLVFFSLFLVRKYNKKYIIDIRDYSPVYRIWFCRWLINIALRNSYANSISSEGFKLWLPKDSNYILSHNVGKDLLNTQMACNIDIVPSIKILTIGLIRDFKSNSKIISVLANNPLFEFSFIGEGPDTPLLKDYVLKNQINNVVFYGRYAKIDESSIVEKYSLINNYMANNVLSNSLVSNRFYLSLLYGKPMIVRDGSFQATLVRKYDLGIIIGDDDDFECKICSYFEHFNKLGFDAGRACLLEKIKKDISIFESVLAEFVK